MDALYQGPTEGHLAACRARLPQWPVDFLPMLVERDTHESVSGGARKTRHDLARRDVRHPVQRRTTFIFRIAFADFDSVPAPREHV